jgi:DNA-binding NtrC family response regulator
MFAGDDTRTRLLVVEDDDRISSLLKAALTTGTVTAEVVLNVDEALASLARTTYDHVLVDLDLLRSDLLVTDPDHPRDPLPANPRNMAALDQALHQSWTLDRLEHEYIALIMKHTRGHRSRAAELLGVDRRTLYRKLKQLGRDLQASG